jgi:hypothetical protein
MAKKQWTKEQLEGQKIAKKEIELLKKNPRLMLAPYEELTPVEPKKNINRKPKK